MGEAIFNLFDLLVYNTFGGLFMTYLGLFFVYGYIGIISNMSPTLLFTLLILFTAIYMTGYMGAIVAVLIFVVSTIYFISSIINFFNKIRT